MDSLKNVRFFARFSAVKQSTPPSCRIYFVKYFPQKKVKQIDKTCETGDK